MTGVRRTDRSSDRVWWAEDGARQSTAVVVVTCALIGGLVTGCTGGDPVPDPSAPPKPSETAEPEPAAEATPQVRRGPLEELLDTVDQVSAESPEATLARLTENEELVAACMAEEGFEYTPTDWRANPSALEEAPRARGAVDVDLVAAAALYGYGISTQALFDEAQEAPAPVVDPNAERVAAMSSAERQAWDLALAGPGQGDAYHEGREAYDWTQYGCQGRAGHEQEAAAPESRAREGFDDSAWSDLRDAIWELEASVPADPRLADARTGWSSCMAAAGYPGYDDPSDATMEIVDRASRIWEQAGGGVQFDLSTDEYLTDPAYLAQQAEVERLEAELAQVEIALAVADTTCQVEVGYGDAYVETWIALQEEFYAAHRTDLDAWLAAFEEFQAAAD